jgi:hypothetical protein
LKKPSRISLPKQRRDLKIEKAQIFLDIPPPLISSYFFAAASATSSPKYLPRTLFRKIESNSKAEYLRIIDSLSNQGAEAVILGCTEIGMLVNQEVTEIRLLNTTEIHAEKAVGRAL